MVPARHGPFELALNVWGAVAVDANLMTCVPGIFSGGDAVRGPCLVVHAVRDGRTAAAGIDRYVAVRGSTMGPSGRPGSGKQNSNGVALPERNLAP